VCSWWKDICDLEVCVDGKNWVAESISRIIGNGARTSFWKDKWCGDVALNIKFPRLFSLAILKEANTILKEANIRDLVLFDGDRKDWNFAWRRRLFQWEEEEVLKHVEEIDGFRFSNLEDRWSHGGGVWIPKGGFSVKSAFEAPALELVPGPNLSLFEENIFGNIWDSLTPSKVIAFSWQLLFDRVPTKENLLLRGVLPPTSDDHCVWCDGVRESSLHLFLHCKVAITVWYEIFKWLGLVIVIPQNLFYLFACLSDAGKNKKVRNGFRLIWHSVIWSIWRARNNHIFNNVVSTPPLELVEEVKVLSWRWSAARLKITPCLFYEWSWDPGDCFER
jgi:hypothetical protein